MTREEWQRVKGITSDALACPEEERARFVAAHCADAGLRREVHSLIAASLAAHDLFEHSIVTVEGAQAVLAATQTPPDALVGQRIGSYKVVGELGRGGMGAAYLAERIDGAYHRRVAIKLIKRGMDTDAIVSRFVHERQILANLNHPNIAMLLDGGSSDDGRPYFVIEYVEGLPIDAYCREQALSVERRLQLFRAVCEAVDHAHENRVIHRDLKPGNILVTRTGVPKLLDFGIATLLDPQNGTAARDNTTFSRAMTLRYASPEQVRGGEPITAASDVYSLGVLLYELLTGSPPYSSSGKGRLEAERLVTEQMPPPPSRAVDSRADGENAPPAQRRELAGNLDAIVLTALQKEPARRYATARALGDDIERHLRGLPIAARPPRRFPQLFGAVRSGRGILVPALVVSAAAVVAVVAWRNRAVPAADFPIASVAVMPLESAEPNPELEYLSDGLTESIIHRLSRLSRVRVIARDSVFSYKGKPIDAVEVGRRLGVEAILTGLISHRGDQLTIRVDLIDTRDRRHLWGREYRPRAGDVQLLQAGVAQQIADGLRLELSAEERTQFARGGTLDTEAYHLYLKGRYFLNKRTVADMRRSIDYLTQAVAKEPNFAAAYAALAAAHGLLTEYHGAPARDTYGAARDAASRALELDDELSEAQSAMGFVKRFYEWDLAGAEAAFRRALAVNPGDATAHQWYAELLSTMGRHDEAVAEIRRATDSDPLSLIANSVEAYLLYMARRYDEAVEQSRKVIDLDPNFPEVYVYLKRALDELGRFDEAVDARQTRRRLLGLDPRRSEALRAAAAAADRTVYWRRRLEQEIAESKTEGTQPFEMVEILAQTGDRAGALDWLERACADSDAMTVYLRVIPTVDPLRREPRFQSLVAKGCAVDTSPSGPASAGR